METSTKPERVVDFILDWLRSNNLKKTESCLFNEIQRHVGQTTATGTKCAEATIREYPQQKRQLSYPFESACGDVGTVSPRKPVENGPEDNTLADKEFDKTLTKQLKLLVSEITKDKTAQPTAAAEPEKATEEAANEPTATAEATSGPSSPTPSSLVAQQTTPEGEGSAPAPAEAKEEAKEEDEIEVPEVPAVVEEVLTELTAAAAPTPPPAPVINYEDPFDVEDWPSADEIGFVRVPAATGDEMYELWDDEEARGYYHQTGYMPQIEDAKTDDFFAPQAVYNHQQRHSQRFYQPNAQQMYMQQYADPYAQAAAYGYHPQAMQQAYAATSPVMPVQPVSVEPTSPLSPTSLLSTEVAAGNSPEKTLSTENVETESSSSSGTSTPPGSKESESTRCSTPASGEATETTTPAPAATETAEETAATTDPTSPTTTTTVESAVASPIPASPTTGASEVSMLVNTTNSTKEIIQELPEEEEATEETEATATETVEEPKTTPEVSDEATKAKEEPAETVNAEVVKEAEVVEEQVATKDTPEEEPAKAAVEESTVSTEEEPPAAHGQPVEPVSPTSSQSQPKQEVASPTSTTSAELAEHQKQLQALQALQATQVQYGQYPQQQQPQYASQLAQQQAYQQAYQQQYQQYYAQQQAAQQAYYQQQLQAQQAAAAQAQTMSEEERKKEENITYEAFDLKVIYQRGKTGFEEHKDFPIKIGCIIAGRYQILEQLGAAAFSRAVQCVDLKTGQLVCIKIIRNNKDFFDQSLDEIKLLQHINASGDADGNCVLQLYDYFYHKEHLFLVCELLRDNLYEFSKYNRENGDEPYFTIPRLQKIARQVLTALIFTHGLNLIHCDLKPENILIKSYSRCEIKVIDFGSSCFTSDHLSSYVQSRCYRAPEVILGLPYNQKIDIWSLGAILAELLTGHVLFHNESVATMMARIVSICGKVPENMVRKGRYAHRFFTKRGVLFERVQINKHAAHMFYLYPKRTKLSNRLGTGDNLFLDFVRQMLQIDPAKRPTAKEAMEHPFLSHDYGPIN
eukprot:TRINITY_DN61571_c0_g1_i1.p1 TRINITY_DN61571_c0_g1~~TRINITY_DN61571_c0_g1_i1.p1  ORF type:complete len:1030 (-),score=224.02 TRINITY_DN61571_c0_g1_i1:159-3248(-)